MSEVYLKKQEKLNFIFNVTLFRDWAKKQLCLSHFN